MDLLATIRANLIADTNVTDLVSATDIRIESNPVGTSNKEILLKETLGKSDIKLDANSGIFTILVYVKDSVDESYETLKAITLAVLVCLDKKQETLKDSDSFVRFFVKASGDFAHNSKENYWMANIIFDYVVGE